MSTMPLRISEVPEMPGMPATYHANSLRCHTGPRGELQFPVFRCRVDQPPSLQVLQVSRFIRRAHGSKPLRNARKRTFLPCLERRMYEM